MLPIICFTERTQMFLDIAEFIQPVNVYSFTKVGFSVIQPNVLRQVGLFFHRTSRFFF